MSIVVGLNWADDALVVVPLELELEPPPPPPPQAERVLATIVHSSNLYIFFIIARLYCLFYIVTKSNIKLGE